MKKNILAICDEEMAYCNRVASYLSTHGFHHYSIMTFSTMERLEEYFNQENDKIEILLIGEDTYRESKLFEKVSKIIILQDKGIQKIEGVAATRKYQSVSKLMKSVSELYAQDINCKGMLSTTANKTKLFGIYTPGEADVSHVCACAFAQILAEKKRVLYLNLASYASLKGLFTDSDMDQQYDLGDLLYFLKQNEEKASYKIDAIKHSIGKLDYILPIAYPSDLKEIEIEDWRKLFHYFSQRSEYEIVVLDFGEALTNLYEMLELCDYIVTPVTENPFLQERMRVFTQMCREKGMEAILEKMNQLEMEENERYFNCLQEIRQGYLGNRIRDMVKKYDL